jgi:hypothetical protein
MDLGRFSLTEHAPNGNLTLTRLAATDRNHRLTYSHSSTGSGIQCASNWTSVWPSTEGALWQCNTDQCLWHAAQYVQHVGMAVVARCRICQDGVSQRLELLRVAMEDTSHIDVHSLPDTRCRGTAGATANVCR